MHALCDGLCHALVLARLGCASFHGYEHSFFILSFRPDTNNPLKCVRIVEVIQLQVFVKTLVCFKGFKGQFPSLALILLRHVGD